MPTAVDRALQHLATTLATVQGTPFEVRAADVTLTPATLRAMVSADPTVPIGTWLTVFARWDVLSAVLAAVAPVEAAATAAEAKRIAAIGDARLEQRRLGERAREIASLAEPQRPTNA